MDGVDLKKLIGPRGGLPPSEAYDLAQQTARGLVAIHEAGIVHRDLKTANIMRDKHGKVRLMDFGIAKQSGGLTGSTGSCGVVVGTPEYMSPEQAFGDKVDFRSDIYALGIVVFELFTGQVPFKSDSPAVTLLMHLQEQPTLDGAVAARVPGALLPVLRRALAKKPDERYQRCEEMLNDLALAAVGDPGVGSAGASDPTPTPLVAPGGGRARRLSKRGVLGVLAVVLATGVGVGLALRPSSEEREPEVENAMEEWRVPVAAEPSDHGESPAPAGERAGAEDSIVVSPSPHTRAATRTVPTETGELRVGVLPWAEVSVNGVRYGITPLPPLELAPGRYVVRLVHSGYKPILRKVTIRSDEVTQLNVDFGLVGIPK